jgi:hypothetical protein
MDINSRVASKGVAENVEGTLQELAEMLQYDLAFSALDPALL